MCGSQLGGARPGAGLSPVYDLIFMYHNLLATELSPVYAGLIFMHLSPLAAEPSPVYD